MINEVVLLKDAIKVFSIKDKENKPYPFDLTYRTFNSQTKKGGKIKSYLGVKHLPDANPNKVQGKSEAEIFAVEKVSRKPDHFDNRTRNIELQSGEIKKIRIDFIISVNGKKVIY